MTDTANLSRERADLLEALRAHRAFLRHPADGLPDDQARQRPTVSALSVGGIVKHVAETEAGWAQFMTGAGLPGSDASTDWSNPDPAMVAAYEQGFTLLADETLDGVLARYDEVAAATD